MIDNNPIWDYLFGISEGKIPEAHTESFFIRFFDSIPVIVCISSVKDDKFIYVNQRFSEVFEFTKEQVIGKTLEELSIVINKFDYKRTKKMILDKESIRNNEFCVRTRTGKTITVLFSGDLFKYGNKKYIFSFIVDITERKNIEKRLASFERLKLMGELAASIGHEIRNPLNTVYGFLQLNKLKGCYTLTEDNFDLMISELQRANSIIDEFLYLSKEKSLNKVKHNLTRIIFRIAPLINTEAARSRKYVKIELSNIPDQMLDESEIRQLVFNMVRNGLEAMEEEKCITIKTYMENGKIVLMVKDEGTGINTEVMEKLGSPFFTTKENGTGLGLSNCYNIAQRHNATISIDTGPEGTTFRVIFDIGQKEKL